MKHGDFVIEINKNNGGLLSIVNSQDTYRMNWCETDSGNSWGTVKGMQLVSTEEEDGSFGCIYKNNKLSVTVTRGFKENGRFFETYKFTNITGNDVFIKRGDIGIYATFNDNYESAEISETVKCHTHIWCGENVAYVNALKMGVSDINLGLILTSGSIDAYSIERDFKKYSDDRGDFILHPAGFDLMPGESDTLEWELFWHEGKEDFLQNTKNISKFH